MNKHANPARAVQGILLLDKPIDMSSNQALQRVKKIYRAQKAGHTGSLDPKATGLLPICFGQATKVSSFLLESDKRYVTVCALGVKTSTGDREGEVIEKKSIPPMDRTLVEQTLKKFTGTISQVPPMHSAIKFQGKPLYKLAHQGIEVTRPSREVTVKSIQLLDINDRFLKFDILCSKGTYIRTLIEDIGEVLGCGAHVHQLCRTQAGPYHIGDAKTLETLQQTADFQTLDAYLMPIETALAHWPAVQVSPDSGYYLRQGQAVFIPHAPEPGWVRIYEKDNRFLGMGKILEDGRVAPKRLIHG